MATSEEVIKGDYGYNIDFTVAYESGTAVNLTGLTIKMDVYNAETGLALLSTAACTTAGYNPVAGECGYTVVTGNFSTAGEYDVELHIYDGSTTSAYRRTVRGLTLKVLDEHPFG
jgi:hypothetical protein